MASNTNVTPTSQVISETWAEAAVAISLVALRIITQAKLVGLRHLHKDDFLMMIALVGNTRAVLGRTTDKHN